MKRSLILKHNDGSESIELELGNANIIKTSNEETSFIYIEKRKDGKWRLTATDNLIQDFTKVDQISIHRED